MFKEQSMNFLSHEVLTPINSIINSSEFLKPQNPNDGLHEMVEMIEIKPIRLNNVVMNVQCGQVSGRVVWKWIHCPQVL